MAGGESGVGGMNVEFFPAVAGHAHAWILNFSRGYQKSHAKIAKPRRGSGRRRGTRRMEKGGFLIGEEIAHVPKSWDTLTRGFWIRGSSIRSFPSGKELGRPGTVVRTGAAG